MVCEILCRPAIIDDYTDSPTFKVTAVLMAVDLNLYLSTKTLLKYGASTYIDTYVRSYNYHKGIYTTKESHVQVGYYS